MPEAPVPATLELEGEIDIARAGDLRLRALELAASAAAVRLDCERVERFDLSAIQVLLALREELHRKGGTLALERIAPAVAQYLETAGLKECLE